MESIAPTTARRGLGSLLCSALAGGVATTTSLMLGELVESAGSLPPQEQLIGWILCAAAIAAAVLSLYLCVLWALAGSILLAGPTSRLGARLLRLLRVLSPRLARRITMTAVLASTATTLTLGTATAAELPEQVADDVRPALSQNLQLLDGERTGPADPPPGSSGAEPSAADPSDEAEALPPLGWGGGGTPAAPPATAPVDMTAEPVPAPQRTVTVQTGDTLWSLTDDLLGPGPEDPEAVCAAWPVLHSANRSVIGPDPDRLIPGQELTVPAELDTQEER